jgi:hypothetical protein
MAANAETKRNILHAKHRSSVGASPYTICHRTMYYILIAVAVLITYEIYAISYFSNMSASIPHASNGAVAVPQVSELDPGKGLGHLLGYIGSIFMILALVYPVRSRSEWFSQRVARKFWMDMHVFFGFMGGVLITFHTTFKIGGLVSISYWSMVIVILSGLVGRFIYTQIPRNIAGNEMKIDELEMHSSRLLEQVRSLIEGHVDIEGITDSIVCPGAIKGKRSHAVLSFILLDSVLFRYRLSKEKRVLFRRLKPAKRVRKEMAGLLDSLSHAKRRIALLEKFQEMLEYWRLLHLKLSILMCVFMFLHVVVAILFYVEN